MDKSFTWKINKTKGVLHHMDCLEGIRQLSDKSIKAIITDPPYCMGLTSNGKKGTFTDLNIAGVFFRELLREFERILAEDGCIYFFCDWRGYAFYFQIFDEILGVKNLLVWDKGSGTGNFYTYVYELTIFYTKNNRFHGKVGSNIIRNIKGFSDPNTKKREGAKIHDAQKPIQLIEKYIMDSTQEYDTVLDCFSGSGTTGISCRNLKRNFIGYEINKINFEKSIERMKNSFEE